jgi:hypothetical protein
MRVTTLGLGMSIRKLAQPYLVYVEWDITRDEVMGAWLEENMNHYFVVAFINAGSWIIPSRSDRKAETETMAKSTMQFQFECPRDALLFKITWGGK